MGKKKVLAWLVFAAAALAAGGWLSVAPEAPATDRPQAIASEGIKPQDSRFAALPARETIGKPAGALFQAHSWTPPAPAPQVVAQASAQPAPPPMPYRVAGKVIHDGAAQVLLARGDALLSVREGDSLEGDYRVESIRGDSVTLVYVPLELRQELPVASVLASDARPAQAQAAPGASAAPLERAQLRWQGPERVRTGDKFEVTLKVTSPEALRAAPLQLTFDATLLEALEVRPGRFFADGSFSYRVNPGGSIFVGASGKGAPAADAELFVVSFKPIRPALAAELKVSALLLQGTGGRAIVHEQPATFRTAILQ